MAVFNLSAYRAVESSKVAIDAWGIGPAVENLLLLPRPLILLSYYTYVCVISICLYQCAPRIFLLRIATGFSGNNLYSAV